METNNHNHYIITKANGDKTVFNGDKLFTALKRSGATDDEAKRIVDKVVSMLHQGLKTSKIYKIAYDLLKSESKAAAGRYRLKKAVFDLGPSGYPFEKYVSKLLEFQGYKVRTNVMAHGLCVKHELDVVAENFEKRIMIECKFHRDKGHKNDVKIPLYVHSRFQDMQAAWTNENPESKLRYEGMVVTNTRFSEDAENYGKCVGMRLVSWDYPEGNCLKNWVDNSGLFPITVLSELTVNEKQTLMEKGIVLCTELETNQDLLLSLGLRPLKIKKIIDEARKIIDGL